MTNPWASLLAFRTCSSCFHFTECTSTVCARIINIELCIHAVRNICQADSEKFYLFIFFINRRNYALSRHLLRSKAVFEIQPGCLLSEESRKLVFMMIQDFRMILLTMVNETELRWTVKDKRIQAPVGGLQGRPQVETAFWKEWVKRGQSEGWHWLRRELDQGDLSIGADGADRNWSGKHFVMISDTHRLVFFCENQRKTSFSRSVNEKKNKQIWLINHLVSTAVGNKSSGL